jgi:hypothetical protein
MTALADMASNEIRDRLAHLPHVILRLAARRLDPGQHVTIYEEEWLPELTYILKGAQARPITRLITGIRYAFGVLSSAGRIRRLSSSGNSEQGMGRRVVFSAVGLAATAARLLPVAHRARYAEEWASELWGLAQSGAGGFRQLQYALRQLLRVLLTGFALRSRRRRSVAP